MKTKVIILALALIAGLGARYLVEQNQPPTVSVELGKLQSGDQTVQLFDTTDNRLRVLYFGYAHCPDVCPTSLAILAAALKSLPEETLSGVRPIFVTLDPKRDDANIAKEYAGYFHPMLEGTSGSTEEIDALAKKYGVLYQITELENSAMEYAVDHSSYFYFVEPDGTLVEKVPHTLNPNIVSDAIKRLSPSAQR